MLRVRTKLGMFEGYDGDHPGWGRVIPGKGPGSAGQWLSSGALHLYWAGWPWESCLASLVSVACGPC